MASNTIQHKVMDKLITFVNLFMKRKKHAINVDKIQSRCCSIESLNTWDIIPDVLPNEQTLDSKLSHSNEDVVKNKSLINVLNSEIMHCSTDSGYSDIEEDENELESILDLHNIGVNNITHVESNRIPDITNECCKYGEFLENTSNNCINNLNLESEELLERSLVKHTSNTCSKITTDDISLINFNQYSSAYKTLVKQRFESSSNNQLNDISDKCTDLFESYQSVTSHQSKWKSPHSGYTYNGIMNMQNVHGKGKPQYKVTKQEKVQANGVCVSDLNTNDKQIGYSTRAKRLIRKSKHDSVAKFRSISSSRKSNIQAKNCHEQNVQEVITKGEKEKQGFNESNVKLRSRSETRHSSRKLQTVSDITKNKVVEHKKQVDCQYQNKDHYLEKLNVCKEQQICLLEKRRSQLHKMIDSWYEQLHNQLEFTYEQEYDRVSKSCSSSASDNESEDSSSAFKSPSMMCSVLNTQTSLYPQDFGTFNTHYIKADPDIWAYEMKEATHIRTFESRDNDVYTEYMATSLTVNKDGNFIVSDLGADTCRLFSSEGQLLSDFDVYPLSEPSNVLPLDNGCYMVSCRDGLQLFDSKGEHKGNRDTPKDIKCPQCVAVDKKGNYIVSDMHDCGSVIITLEKDSLLPLRMFCGSQFHESPMCFKKAWYIHVTEDDKIMLSDRDDHTVKCYSKHGEFQWSKGGLGSKNGQFVTPAGITEDKFGNIIVADCGNDRVQIFSANGDWLGEIVSDYSHGIISPTDVAITNDGNLAVLQSNGTVAVFKYLHKLT